MENYGFYGILKWEVSPYPSIPLSFPPFPSPPFPSFPFPCHLLFHPLTINYRGSVERCELPQLGVGEAPTDVEFWRNLGTRNHVWWYQIVTFSYKLSVPIYQSNTIKSDSVAITRTEKFTGASVVSQYTGSGGESDSDRYLLGTAIRILWTVKKQRQTMDSTAF